MGSWVEEPVTADGEEVLWRRGANRQQGPRRVVGGRIFLTNQRVIFMANRVDHATGGDDWSRPLTDIVNVSVEPRRYGIPLVTANVGLRQRLRMECRDGTAELFVVNHVEEAVDRVRSATSTAP